jgi:hypothetical protein
MSISYLVLSTTEGRHIVSQIEVSSTFWKLLSGYERLVTLQLSAVGMTLYDGAGGGHADIIRFNEPKMLNLCRFRVVD